MWYRVGIFIACIVCSIMGGVSFLIPWTFMILMNYLVIAKHGCRGYVFLCAIPILYYFPVETMLIYGFNTLYQLSYEMWPLEDQIDA